MYPFRVRSGQRSTGHEVGHNCSHCLGGAHPKDGVCERADATTVTDVRVDATTVTDVRVDTHLRKCCHYKSRLWAGATTRAGCGLVPLQEPYTGTNHRSRVQGPTVLRAVAGKQHMYPHGEERGGGPRDEERQSERRRTPIKGQSTKPRKRVGGPGPHPCNREGGGDGTRPRRSDGQRNEGAKRPRKTRANEVSYLCK